MANSLHAFLTLTQPFPKDKNRSSLRVCQDALQAKHISAERVGGWGYCRILRWCSWNGTLRSSSSSSSFTDGYVKAWRDYPGSHNSSLLVMELSGKLGPPPLSQQAFCCPRLFKRTLAWDLLRSVRCHLLLQLWS